MRIAATIRVAQVATGGAGRLTLRQLIADDRFELVAVSTSSPDKVGVDAGRLAGLDVTTGIVAVGSLDELVAAAPDCVVYCAMGDTRQSGDRRRTPAAGGRHRRGGLGSRHLQFRGGRCRRR